MIMSYPLKHFESFQDRDLFTLESVTGHIYNKKKTHKSNLSNMWIVHKSWQWMQPNFVQPLFHYHIFVLVLNHILSWAHVRRKKKNSCWSDWSFGLSDTTRIIYWLLQFYSLWYRLQPCVCLHHVPYLCLTQFLEYTLCPPAARSQLNIMLLI